jgi:nicotinamidase-related amidase
MTSEATRDPLKDHLLTPQNAAFIVIDYQPVQVNSIASMDRPALVKNIVGTAKTAVAYGLPVVHSTVNVKNGKCSFKKGHAQQRAWPFCRV